MKKEIVLSVVMASVFASPILADHGKGPIGGRTISGTPLHEGMVSLSAGLVYTDTREFSDGRLVAFAQNGRDVDSVDRSFEYFLSAAYGATKDVTLSLSLPYLRVEDFREGLATGEIETADPITGLGDATLFAKYRLWSEGFDFSLLGGLKLPTGSTSEETDGGERLEGDHQPGTGSWDPLVGMAATWRGERLILSGSALFRLATEGDQDFEAGDVLTVGVAAQYQVSPFGDFPRVWATFEVSNVFRSKDQFDGERDADSGGSTLFLAPGVKVEIAQGVTLALSFAWPVYQGLFGEQHEERFEVLFGISVDARLFPQ